MSDSASPRARGHVIPRYRADGAAFYHFLHGTVPGHQIDFMYCPEVPQGALRQVHFGHLARLIKYIEPRDNAPFAFAIGNLSRDDVQHTPGRGGVAVLFALRVPGVVDHAGRDMPPYAHGVVAVDRDLTYSVLLQTVTALHRHFLEREGAEDRRGDFYRSYVHTMREAPEEAAALLAASIQGFDDLPSPPKSTLGWDYVVDDSESPRQIALVHDEPMEIGTVAHWASALAALLYRSNIKWTSVSTGREIDIAGGTTIRFVPRSAARAGLRCPTYELDDLPEDEAALAALLFGARPRGAATDVPPAGWREAREAQRAELAGAEVEIPVDVGDLTESAANRLDVDDGAATIPMASALCAGGEPRSYLATAGGPGAVGPALTSVPSAPDMAGEQTAGRGRPRGHWVMIAGAATAVAITIVVVVMVAAILNTGTTAPPDSRDAGEARPSAAASPAPSGPPDASGGNGDAGPGTRTGATKSAPASGEKALAGGAGGRGAGSSPKSGVPSRPGPKAAGPGTSSNGRPQEKTPPPPPAATF